MNTSAGSILNYYDEYASAEAKVTGTSATCDVNILYEWTLSYGTTDPVYFDYDLVIIPTTLNLASDYGAVREHQSELPSLTKVPANGSITTIPVSATI